MERMERTLLEDLIVYETQQPMRPVIASSFALAIFLTAAGHQIVGAKLEPSGRIEFYFPRSAEDDKERWHEARRLVYAAETAARKQARKAGRS